MTEALAHKLDLLRGDIEIELHVTAALLSIANTYAELGFDEQLNTAMNDARNHMRRGLELTARLMRERSESEVSAEAAQEWRAQRNGRRSA